MSARDELWEVLLLAERALLHPEQYRGGLLSLAELVPADVREAFAAADDRAHALRVRYCAELPRAAPGRGRRPVLTLPARPSRCALCGGARTLPLYCALCWGTVQGSVPGEPACEAVEVLDDVLAGSLVGVELEALDALESSPAAALLWRRLVDSHHRRGLDAEVVTLAHHAHDLTRARDEFEHRAPCILARHARPCDGARHPCPRVSP